MTEYYVELQDANGTGYGTPDKWTDEDMYFEDLDEARMYAKSCLSQSDDCILARVIEAGGLSRVVDFFEK